MTDDGVCSLVMDLGYGTWDLGLTTCDERFGIGVWDLG